VETALTPLDFKRRTLKLHAGREAVVDGERRWTYAQFFERCDRWSAALSALGVGKGSRVAYIASNTHAQLESFYAVPQLGAVLVPINFRLMPEEWVYMINHSGAQVVCAHDDFVAAIQSVRGQLPHVQHFVALEGAHQGWLDYEQLIAASDSRVPDVAIDERDLLTINYTSGTTSRPKGVMITHRNAWVNAVGTLVHLPLRVGERYLWTLPMFHANGWTFTWIVTAAAATHVCLRKVDPLLIYRLLAEERIDMLCAAPTVLIGLANVPAEVRASAPRGLRIVTAGAPPAAATIETIESLGWTVTQVYGLTETAPFITVSELLPEHRSLGSSERCVIKARQGVELITSGDLRVVDETGGDVPRDAATLGEIVVRGNVVMAGYYQDPAATSAAMGDGWFHSGDAAVVHPDGYVEIRDRLKDVIISGGENISSVEVEALLLRHPAVREAGVVGLKDDKWGEAPHAFIVLKDRMTATPEELRAFCRAHLAHFKTPHSFRFITELPKTATGKIQKYVLRGGKPNLSVQ
jgi:fatty-acyl-CoA synthase